MSAIQNLLPDRPRIRAVIFDLDGVIYRGGTLLPGAGETIADLRRRDIRPLYCTNNSTRSRAEYVAKLQSLGIAATAREIMTSSRAAALYLSNRIDPAKEVYVVGEQGMVTELLEVGVKPTTEIDSGVEIEFVVAGLDRAFTYDKLRQAVAAIQGGAQFLATNRDATLPDDGRIVPGAGAIVAAITTAAGVEPLELGKPRPEMISLLLKEFGVNAENSVMVGDRLDTDIIAGHAAGCLTCLVLTGVSSAAEAADAPAARRPEVILPSVAELPRLWRAGGV